MGEVNKAKQRKSQRSKVYYAQQYGVTYKNKRNSIRKHIACITAFMYAYAAKHSANYGTEDYERKMFNFRDQIADAELALESLKLKR